MQTVTVVDEASGEGTRERFEVEVDGVRLTPRELIRQFVLVAYGSTAKDSGTTAAAAGGTGRLIDFLRGPKPLSGPEAAVRTALDAFEANRFVLLVGPRQAQWLDEPLELGPDDEITFLRLVPLRGG